MDFKQLVLEKLRDDEADWFGQLYHGEFLDNNGDPDSEANKLIDKYHSTYKVIYHSHSGDGSLRTIVFEFTFDDGSKILILVEGYFNSWSADEWTDVYEAKPYTFTEIRYERK